MGTPVVNHAGELTCVMALKRKSSHLDSDATFNESLSMQHKGSVDVLEAEQSAEVNSLLTIPSTQPQEAQPQKGGHACTGCHKAKVKCNGILPCERCVKKNLVCEPHGRSPGRPCKKQSKDQKSDPDSQVLAATGPKAAQPWKGPNADSWFKRTLRRTIGTAQRYVAPALALLTERFLHESHPQSTHGPVEEQVHDLVMGSIRGLMRLSGSTPDEMMTGARALLPSAPGTMLSEPHTWLPDHFLNMMKSSVPTFLKISVLGEHRILHNSAWQNTFHSVEELKLMARHCMVEPAVIEFPLIPIVACPYERRKLITSLLQDLLKSDTTFDHQGVAIHESDSSSQICVCIDRTMRKFLGLIKMRTCLLKQGAIGVQGMSFVELPPSPHLSDPESSTSLDTAQMQQFPTDQQPVFEQQQQQHPMGYEQNMMPQPASAHYPTHVAQPHVQSTPQPHLDPNQQVY